MSNVNESLNTLFPSARERQVWDDALTKTLNAVRTYISQGPVTPTIDMDSFREELSRIEFSDARPIGDLLSWTIAKMQHGIVQMTNPRYFGLFNPAPTFPSECADRIVAAFNPQLATSTSSPVPVEIEAHTIRAVGRRAGFAEPVAGHFTAGGSEANFTGLLCALTRSHPEFSTRGARALPGPAVFYVSRECHLAWLKIAHSAGIGRSAVQFIQTDGAGRLDTRDLDGAINADKARGYHPVMIVATAGTTNAGMIDPLSECAELARKWSLWLHIDAAWGGALIASDKMRHKLSGLERADSLTIDAHKWFATTMSSGMFLTRHAVDLSSTFAVSTDFMPSYVNGVDPYVTSMQWSRRFIGLRLFLSLAAAGWSGYGRHVDRAVELAHLLSRRLVSKGWLLANIPDLAVVCIEPPPGSSSPRAIVDKLLKTGRVWASVAKFENRDVIRACITHGATSIDDVNELVDALDAAR